MHSSPYFLLLILVLLTLLLSLPSPSHPFASLPTSSPPFKSISHQSQSQKLSTKLHGIPKMFRALTSQYPTISRHLSQGLPVGAKVDNFYLDMNGIIHPMTHDNAVSKSASNKSKPKKGAPSSLVLLDESEMHRKIFNYLDTLYKLILPRKVLYLAVDGPAPRAKMNQQRARRYRAGKELEDAVSRETAASNENENDLNFDEIDEINATPAADSGLGEDEEYFDSNCITPGTTFMTNLNAALHNFVKHQFLHDPLWYKNDELTVVVSGSDVAGEGEHKIMRFIRTGGDVESEITSIGGCAIAPKRVASNDFGNYGNGSQWVDSEDKPFSHVLYGLDADLIMLGLVTREPEFKLLREKLTFGKPKNNQRTAGSEINGKGKGPSRGEVWEEKKDPSMITRADFEVLDLKILRDMFGKEFYKLKTLASKSSSDDDDSTADSERGVNKRKTKTNNSKSNVNNNHPTNPPPGFFDKYDIDRITDDFVFLSMLVGNDFLPHIPHLGIDQGALSILMTLYTDLVSPPPHLLAKGFLGFAGVSGSVEGKVPYLTDREKISTSRLRLLLQQLSSYESPYFERRGADEKDSGWQGRKIFMLPDGSGRGRYLTPQEYYYNLKLNFLPPMSSKAMKGGLTADVKTLAESYTEGLHWVMQYYHVGCKGWSWFYPYLYSPLCSSLQLLAPPKVKVKGEVKGEEKSVEKEEVFVSHKFKLSAPPTPLIQLLSVLPPQSAQFLPPSYASLMSSDASPLFEFYPRVFETDQNGKKNAWEAVVKIPFLDDNRLKEVVSSMEAETEEDGNDDSVEGRLTDEEKIRNAWGVERVYRSNESAGYTANAVKGFVVRERGGERGGERGSMSEKKNQFVVGAVGRQQFPRI